MSYSRYWSCSKFANLLRGTPKIKAGTSEEWRHWNRSAKEAHPIRFWLAEEGLGKLQRFVNWPCSKLYDIKYYVNNRWITKTHALTAHTRDITPGKWHDVGNRFLPCLFNELVDFVEIEVAGTAMAWDVEERKKYNPPFWAFGWFKVRTWRCPQAGLDNLKWQSALTNDDETKTLQAIAATEILELYNWWINTYRNRPDPYVISGWNAYCERKWAESEDKYILSIFDKVTDQKLVNDKKQAMELLDKIEREYQEEDEAMLIRLIKVRNSLWT